MVRCYDLGSDHRPIDANLRLEHKEVWGTAERMDYFAERMVQQEPRSQS